MNLLPTFNHFDISHTSLVAAVQHARDWIELTGVEAGAGGDDVQTRASALLFNLYGVHVHASEVKEGNVGTLDVWATILAQAGIEVAFKKNFTVDEEEVPALIEQIRDRARKFILNPNRSYMFATAAPTATSTTSTVVSKLVDTAVEVKQDGTIKKGGKEVMAWSLYQQYRAAATFDPNNENQPFIAVLMKELAMTKAGATTYNYNMKKKYAALQ